MPARPTLADLAARLDAVEAVVNRAWVREDPETRLRELHGHLWADLGPGPVVVTGRRCVEIWAAHKRFVSAATAETYLTQMTGLGLAASLSPAAEHGKTVKNWGLAAPPK
jgi:hypothetical protein